MKIGFIGTGVMGRSMCMHLIKAGNEAYVYNRTKSKADDLVAAGATWCEGPKEVASKADVIFSIVGFPKDVEETILGENGVLAGCSAGKIIVDMTTSKPSLAERINAEAVAKGVESLDAPVSGGDLGAQNGTLAIMVGGKKDVFEKVLPLFEIMGKNIKLMGAPGAGQHTKMSNQILISGTMIGAVESLLYAHTAGLDISEVISAIGSGAAGSWTINNLGPKIAKKDFDPGFFIKHFVKDMGIALEEARRMNIALPGLALVNQFYISAMAMGYENLGTQALYKVFENMNSKF